MTHLARTATGALAAITGAKYLANTAAVYGLTRKLAPRTGGDARRVTAPGLIGVEDLSIDEDNGIAYMAAADRRTARRGGIESGGLYSYDLTQPDSEPQLISDPSVPLYPHGVSLWISPEGDRELYVVDHAGGRHSVRRYGVDKHRAELIDVYAHPLIHSPNDLTAIGPGEFYVTNDHGFHGQFGQAAEQFLRLPISNVVHVVTTNNEVRYEVALKGVPFANGIAWHPTTGEMFLSAMTRREVWRCSVEADGTLRKIAAYPTDMCVDNIEIDAAGDLWIGGHPQILKLVQYDKNPAILSPSQVIRMNPRTGNYVTVFEDDGSLISGCSVGARWRDRLLVGCVMEAFIVDITLRPER
ncbi:SMP-30/gluconolactonase/LRE family protein [Streptomyces sp. Tue6028]|uniref:SMP-30/gluconolactonase/LRE family protein n=1 Tax=Streptomyces sp. Tue6028 TaxID=2036037 RepID=UPI003EBCEBE1